MASRPFTRRDVLRLGGMATAGLLAAPAVRRENRAAASQRRRVTAFYQLSSRALSTFGGPEGLPNGPGYRHVFSHSHPGFVAHPATANAVHALGESFAYAPAFDLNKFPGWASASDDQLREWAIDFRALALDPDGPADYFAFNEMPTTGASSPNLRAQVGRLLRHLFDPGDGPPLPGVFFFTERNLNPANWVGDSEDFWETLDATCEVVIGEHYHSYEFAFSLSTERLTAHLFAIAEWLAEDGSPTRLRVATEKYAVLHSSFYGPVTTGWAGVRSDRYGIDELEAYFAHVLAGTRGSGFGSDRIAFGPLAARDLDLAMLPVLASALALDLSS